MRLLGAARTTIGGAAVAARCSIRSTALAQTSQATEAVGCRPIGRGPGAAVPAGHRAAAFTAITTASRTGDDDRIAAVTAASARCGPAAGAAVPAVTAISFTLGGCGVPAVSGVPAVLVPGVVAAVATVPGRG
jgi:hypothetical protein